MISQHNPAFPTSFDGLRKQHFPFFEKSNSFSFFDEYHHQSNNHKSVERKPKEQIPPDLIRTAQYCQQNFRTILPKNSQIMKYPNVMQFNFRSPVITNQVFSPQIVSTLLKQYEIVIQLLIQNLLFTSSDQVKDKTNQMLQLLMKRAFPDKQIPQNLFRVSLNYLQSDQQQDNLQIDDPPYVDCPPIQNIYQMPLINLIPLFQEFSTRAQNRTIEDRINILQLYTPMINSNYVPTFYQQMNKNRCKFTPIDEALLFQGLQKYTSKNLEKIQEEFLWEKKIKQIKNKYKNSICSNATTNKIKQWKQNQYQYLNRSEVKCLIKGLQWFGSDKFQLISKYFVTTRSPEFLQLQDRVNKTIIREVQKSESLLKKRKKHGIPDVYPDFYSSINNFKINENKINPLKRICRNNKSQDHVNQAKEIMKKLSFTEQSNNLPPILMKDENHKIADQENQDNNQQLLFSNFQQGFQSIGAGNVDNFFHFQYLGFENSNSFFRSQHFDFSNFGQNGTFSQMFKEPKQAIKEPVKEVPQTSGEIKLQNQPENSSKNANLIKSVKPNGLQKLIPIIDFFSQK